MIEKCYIGSCIPTRTEMNQKKTNKLGWSMGRMQKVNVGREKTDLAGLLRVHKVVGVLFIHANTSEEIMVSQKYSRSKSPFDYITGRKRQSTITFILLTKGHGKSFFSSSRLYAVDLAVDGICDSKSVTYSRWIVNTGGGTLLSLGRPNADPRAKGIRSEWVEKCSTGLIFIPTRMIMSVEYKPCDDRSVFSTREKCIEEKCAVLTETNAMAVKPGSWIRSNADIKYKICNSVVNPSAIIYASGEWDIPKCSNK